MYEPNLRHCPERHFFLAAIWLFSFCVRVTAADGTGTNGAPGALRPFYAIGHEADTLAVAKEYMEMGANGIECDVNLMAGHTNGLCIVHGPWIEIGPAGKDAVPLKDYLKTVHELARIHTNFCLVYFDCKTLAATPEFGKEIRDDIRQYLTEPGRRLSAAECTHFSGNSEGQGHLRQYR